MTEHLENGGEGRDVTAAPLLNYASGSAEWHAGVRVYRMPNADERVPMPLLARQWVVTVGGMLPTLAAMLYFINVSRIAPTQRLWALGGSIAWMAAVGMSAGAARRFYYRRQQEASFKLMLDEDRIVRHIEGFDDLVIRRDEIVRIEEQPKVLVIRPGRVGSRADFW